MRYEVLRQETRLAKATVKVWFKVVDLDAGLNAYQFPKRVLANCAEYDVAMNICAALNLTPGFDKPIALGGTAKVPTYAELLAENHKLTVNIADRRADLDTASRQRTADEAALADQKRRADTLRLERDALRNYHDESQRLYKDATPDAYVKLKEERDALSHALDTVSVHVNRIAEVLKQPR